MTYPRDGVPEQHPFEPGASYTIPLTGEQPDDWRDACEAAVRYGRLWMFSDPDPYQERPAVVAPC